MLYDDLIRLYEQKKVAYGKETFKYVSEILVEAKNIHRKDFTGKDFEQSWRAFKGKNLEKLIEYILVDEIHKIGLEIISGNYLEKTLCDNLTPLQEIVKRNLLIEYNYPYGFYLPDVDLVVFNPKNGSVLAVLSVKGTLHKHIAKTRYWKLKLVEGRNTSHIKVFFVTLDEDGTLTHKSPCEKEKTFMETDLDGIYVLTTEKVETSDKIKLFNELISDLKKLK